MIVGDPPGLISAMLLPATSVVTRSAKLEASSRHTRAAGPSKPDGAGVSSKRFRKASEDGLSMWPGRETGGGSGEAAIASPRKFGPQILGPLNHRWKRRSNAGKAP